MLEVLKAWRNNRVHSDEDRRFTVEFDQNGRWTVQLFWYAREISGTDKVTGGPFLDLAEAVEFALAHYHEQCAARS